VAALRPKVDIALASWNISFAAHLDVSLQNIVSIDEAFLEASIQLCREGNTDRTSLCGGWLPLHAHGLRGKFKFKHGFSLGATGLSKDGAMSYAVCYLLADDV